MLMHRVSLCLVVVGCLCGSRAAAQGLRDPIPFFRPRRAQPPVQTEADRPFQMSRPRLLNSVDGFVHITAAGAATRFESVEALNRWARDMLNLKEGQNVLLLEQTVKGKRGLRIVAGRKDFIESIRSFLASRRVVERPRREVSAPERIEAAKVEARRLLASLVENGRAASMKEFRDFTSEFNQASASGPDEELTRRTVAFLRTLTAGSR